MINWRLISKDCVSFKQGTETLLFEHIINNYLIKESISIRSMVYEKQYCIVCIQFFREKHCNIQEAVVFY